MPHDEDEGREKKQILLKKISKVNFKFLASKNHLPPLFIFHQPKENPSLPIYLYSLYSSFLS